MTELPGKYLYGIVRCAGERAFEEVAPIGGAPGAVHTVSHLGLAVVVSDSSLTQYESTRANMMAHQRVQERVMKELTILPVRFGTVADSGSPLQQLQKLLESRFQEFDRLLSDMEGKAELGLKALWRDEKAIFQELLAEYASLRRMRHSLAGKPPALVRLEAVALGRLVKESLERKRSQEAAAILAPLRPLALQVRENQSILDRMVVNAAFLVDKRREGEFDQAVSQQEERLEQRLMLRYVGPVPPYNFVNIIVNWHEL